MPSGLYFPQEIYARERNQSGTFYLDELSGIEPNYSDAVALEKAIQQHDPNLRVCCMKWNDLRWGIRWTNAKHEEILVVTCEDENKDYLPPDSRWVEYIKANDMWGTRRPDILKMLATSEQKRLDELAAKSKEEMAGVRENLERGFRNAGWHQREEGDDLKNFSFGYGTHRGKLPEKPSEDE